ncbi:MAG TPA: ISAs1 family transposase [Cytophagales bacterium]|nr:ISAs1 family transposase [Cytophagales bacterium]HAA24212.1 ISAs1 family transposase [Cytophagales bacterium]HAP59169.1 ISAs1 family transposase [Cytophagales bacterium]
MASQVPSLLKRFCSIITDLTFLDGQQQWPGINSLVRIQAERTNKKSGEVQTSLRYYISSKDCQAKAFNRDIRSPWSIENQLHGCLDVNFREGSSKKRKQRSAANFGLFTKMLINLLKAHPLQDSKNIKRLKALMEDNFREELL